VKTVNNISRRFFLMKMKGLMVHSDKTRDSQRTEGAVPGLFLWFHTDMPRDISSELKM
jgi:hypothetical protein